MNFTLNQLKKIENQLPKPFIILGDFNAHSPLWENIISPDSKGKIIEDFLLQTDLCILNNQSPTYLSPITFKTSSVDLSLCSPLLAPSLKWSTLEDTHHSDHFPIIIKNNLK